MWKYDKIYKQARVGKGHCQHLLSGTEKPNKQARVYHGRPCPVQYAIVKSFTSEGWICQVL